MTVKHRGTASPVEAVEEYPVGIAIEMGRIRQPLNCNEALVLMNSFIEGTETQEKLSEFQKARKVATDEFEYYKLTHGWWHCFLRRNAHRLVTKRGERFASSRCDWTTHENIATAYDAIYDEMVDAVLQLNWTYLFTPIEKAILVKNMRLMGLLKTSR